MVQVLRRRKRKLARRQQSRSLCAWCNSTAAAASRTLRRSSAWRSACAPSQASLMIWTRWTRRGINVTYCCGSCWIWSLQLWPRTAARCMKSSFCGLRLSILMPTRKLRGQCVLAADITGYTGTFLQLRLVAASVFTVQATCIPIRI